MKKNYDKENGQEEPELQPSELLQQASLVVDRASQAANLSQAEQVLLAASPDQRESEAYTRIHAGISTAEKRVQSLVTLVVDEGAGGEAQMVKEIKESPAAMIKGDCDSHQHVAIVLDAKVLCESGSQAKWRLPPTRAPQVKRLIGAFLSSRADGELDDADVIVALDGGKNGDWEEKHIVKHLPGKKYAVTKHIVFFNHSSVEKRMERASKGPLDLTENLSYITAGNVPVAVKAR